MDTIFALASARGKSGLAVIRLSGPDAHAAIAELAGNLPPLRHASLRKIVWKGEILDEAIVVLFGHRASFTGEMVAEIQTHGSLAVTQSILRALSEVQGLRLAEAGEFTRRALENECLDLSQVEGLADLIDAETDAQRRQAQRVLSGVIGQRAQQWREKLIRATALIEATIDFVDEDVPVDVTPEVKAILVWLVGELGREIEGSRTAERIRDGFEVAIVGAPNVGKSTLLNAIAGREAAITSEQAGTTRDVIEVRMDLAGLAVTVLDTAGLREAQDPIEGIGIEKAIARAELADLRVFLVSDASEILVIQPKDGDLIVRAKADLGASPTSTQLKLGVSGRTGAGIAELKQMISDTLGERAASAGVMTRERHRSAMLRALGSIESAVTEVECTVHRPELVSANLWDALRSLDMLTGRVDIENLLDEIFSSFCIGK